MRTCNIHADCEITFSRYRTVKGGAVLDAHAYGFKAWPIHSRGK